MPQLVECLPDIYEYHINWGWGGNRSVIPGSKSRLILGCVALEKLQLL